MCHCGGCRVSDTQERVRNTDFVCAVFGSSGEPKFWGSWRSPKNFNISPKHAISSPSSKGFHRSLFRRKTSGEVLCRKSTILAVVNFSIREYPCRKSLPVAAY
jgi:hypothetical protein